MDPLKLVVYESVYIKLDQSLFTLSSVPPEPKLSNSWEDFMLQVSLWQRGAEAGL